MKMSPCTFHRLILSTSGIAFGLAVAGCGDGSGNASQTRDTGATADTADDLGRADIATADARGDTGIRDVDTGTGTPVGQPCEDDSECETGICLDLSAGDAPGICTQPCSVEADCPEEFDCVLLSNSGQDAVRLCVPVNYCADADDDQFGVGPGCLGQDCNDDDPGVNLSADEICDGLDNDCDGRVDDNPINLGSECETGFGGGCNPGTRQCLDGSLICVSNFPQSIEVCDGRDNDCDDQIDEDDAENAPTWYRDADNDRFGDPDDTVRACAAPEGYISAAGDCDDSMDRVNPNAVELCDGLDNNCDTFTDLDDATGARTWYLDADEDGFGDPDVSTVQCAQPDGYVADNTDCNDDATAINPDATELCDDVDNDCDTDIDEDDADDAPRWYADTDEDTFGDPDEMIRACVAPVGYVEDNTDCDDDEEFVNPDAIELCDDIDNNCVDGIDEDSADNAPVWFGDGDDDGFGDPLVTTRACAQPDGFVSLATDCDPERDFVYPNAPELCDGFNNDCDDETDEVGRTLWYRDFDEDTFGNPDDTLFECARPAGYVADSSDCDDGVSAINPAALEVCDNLDNNCVNGIDEDLTRSCYDGPDGTSGVGLCRTGTQTCAEGAFGECTSQVQPATDICDGLDNNCDGVADEGNPGGAVACNTGESGICAAGTTACTAGMLVCNRNSAPGVEVCDGLDNNCDGTADDGNPGGGFACGTGQAGVCSAGVTACQAGGTTCVRTTGPSAEVCDNADNDCNGGVDEGNPGGGQACNTGQVGICAAGTRVCQAGGYACVRNSEPQAEVCDNQDNNCNGTIDEGFNKLWCWDRDGDGWGAPDGCTAACSPPNALYVNNNGDANDFTQFVYPGRPEICDGIDNNQNGVVDEGNVCGNPPGGGTCTGRYDAGLNRGYMFCRAGSNRNRDAHRARCLAQTGMDLALPNDETEVQYLRNTGENGGVFSGGFGEMWIGVQRSGANWIWIATGQVLSFTRFRPGEPSGDGDCVDMRDNEGAWNDLGCSGNRDEAVCEWNVENTRRF